MRKIILSICVCIITIVASAQLTVTGNHFKFDKIAGKVTVTVIIFDSIRTSSEITYNPTYTNLNWYKYTDKNASISNQASLSPEDATGYILVVDGDSTYIWVIDYKKNHPVFTLFEAEIKPEDQCENVNLLINAAVPVFYYKTVLGDSITIQRDFSITYKTLEWNAVNKSWDSKDLSEPLTFPITKKSVPAPLCDTYFKLSGDQFASELHLSTDSITSPLYNAVAVECHITTAVTSPRKHDKNNESEAPYDVTQLSISAPFDVQFTGNANEPVAETYKWEIYKDNSNQPLIIRTDKDHLYSFTEKGTYNVKFVASNKYCSNTDSIKITVSESEISAPNVFTPNDDGFNDEFRVAYKSIISFEAWVYNRWGRLVFHWTDPTKGWDGTINGRKAATGPYYYVIKALGSDFDPNSKPIGNTKLRLGEYLLKGDINLLRGKE
ncbi:MAG TPA: gliding motility-associated C-terminal domain-containing protein [Paludibacter sp.]